MKEFKLFPNRVCIYKTCSVESIGISIEENQNLPKTECVFITEYFDTKKITPKKSVYLLIKCVDSSVND